MLRRRREYYVGGRPNRRRSRLALVLVAIIAIGGATAFASFAPAIGLTSIGSTPTSVPTAAAVDGSTSGPTTTPPSPAPSIGPLPSTTPAVSRPDPCRPPEHFEPARVVSHGDIHRKTVALTFDDGIDPENTKRILRILRKYKVNATFFPTGRSVERFPDVWRAIARAGYPIANHTYGHDSLAGKCFDPQRRDLAKAAAVLDGQGIPELAVMRPPYELFDDTTRVAASAAGLEAVILWNIDTKDWAGASVGSIRASALHGGRGSIVLMHTSPDNTAAALPGIIKGYRARGFEFVTIGQMLDIEGAIPFPPKDAATN